MLNCLLSAVFALSAAQAPVEAGSGELLALNKTDATLSFIDGKTGELLAVVGTGVGPHEIAVDAASSRAVVTNYGASLPGSSLTVIDLKRRVPIDTLDLGKHRRPHGIVFLSAGRVLVTCEASQALIEVDLPSRKVVREMATEQKFAHMVAVTPDRTRAFVANIGSGSVSAFDLVAGARTADVPTGKGAEGIAVTPDGREVWVTNREADTISVLDAAGVRVVATLPCASFPIRVQITPDGAWALVSNAKSGDVAVFDVRARTELTRLSLAVTPIERTEERLFAVEFSGSPVPVGILIAPDGRRAFVANTNADVISVLDLSSLTLESPSLRLSGRMRAGREPDGLGWLAR